MKGGLCLFLIPVILLFSCVQDKQPARVSPTIVANPTDTGLVICYDDFVAFRRSFADIQFIDDEKEQDKYVAQQENSNPYLFRGENNPLVNRFEEFGFVKNGEFLERKFKQYIKGKISFIEAGGDFQYTTNSGKKINIRFKHMANGREDNLISTNRVDSIFVKTSFFDELKFAELDIWPGGNKEIVVLREYHIMNGDNFELLVYQITD